MHTIKIKKVIGMSSVKVSQQLFLTYLCRERLKAWKLIVFCLKCRRELSYQFRLELTQKASSLWKGTTKMMFNIFIFQPELGRPPLSHLFSVHSHKKKKSNLHDWNHVKPLFSDISLDHHISIMPNHPYSKLSIL